MGFVSLIERQEHQSNKTSINRFSLLLLIHKQEVHHICYFTYVRGLCREGGMLFSLTKIQVLTSMPKLLSYKAKNLVRVIS